MATVYSTQVNKVTVIKDQDGLTNVIDLVWYYVIAQSDDGYTKVMSKNLTFPKPSPSGFVNINDVTEAMLIQWIEAQPDYLTDSDKQSIEFRIQLERNKPVYDDYKFSWMPMDYLRYNLMN